MTQPSQIKEYETVQCPKCTCTCQVDKRSTKEVICPDCEWNGDMVYV